MYIKHSESHRIKRSGWLRAAVLGANDGIISTTSLILGVAAAHSSHNSILIAGAAGLIAGTLSMAAGEYISVSSQADTEKADLTREKKELAADVEGETEELTGIYQRRGLDRSLAQEVAKQLMEHDALGAHARDELGITESLKARPLQAAFASAGSFSVGAILPLLITLIVPLAYIIPVVSITAILCLILLGGVAAKTGGSNIRTGVLRVTLWGSLAMLISTGIGSLLGVAL